MRDIYNPPPAPVVLDPPQPEPLRITALDIAYLLVMCAGLGVLSAGPWAIDWVLGLGVTAGGLFVILESWFSGLTFLRRHPAARPIRRSMIFLVALMPWAIGLGFAAALMWGLFLLSDLAG